MVAIEEFDDVSAHRAVGDDEYDVRQPGRAAAHVGARIVIPPSCDQTGALASALTTEWCCGMSRTGLVPVEQPGLFRSADQFGTRA